MSKIRVFIKLTKIRKVALFLGPKWRFCQDTVNDPFYDPLMTPFMNTTFDHHCWPPLSPLSPHSLRPCTAFTHLLRRTVRNPEINPENHEINPRKSRKFMKFHEIYRYFSIFRSILVNNGPGGWSRCTPRCRTVSPTTHYPGHPPTSTTVSLSDIGYAARVSGYTTSSSGFFWFQH